MVAGDMMSSICRYWQLYLKLFVGILFIKHSNSLFCYPGESNFT